MSGREPKPEDQIPEPPAGGPGANEGVPARERVEGEYGVEQMQHLSDREHVRQRLGMYIGDAGPKGLHQLVFECVDNSIDEAMAGYATEISVTINPDGSVTVMDNGRGIPVDVHPDLGISALEGVMTRLKFGGKFERQAYKTSGGLHGIGVKVVNFLSEWCTVEVRRDGHVYQQEYERGVPVGPVRRIGRSERTGTKTSFRPDPEIFKQQRFDYNILQRRLQELAFLNAGVHITLRDERTGQSDTFFSKGGLVEFVEFLNRACEPIHPKVIYLNRQQGGIRLEVALQYTEEYTENVHSYANNINTVEGGTHLSGLRTALTRTLKSYGEKQGLFKDITPTGEDFREGLTAVISVWLPEPKFESQTKVKLTNPEVDGIVNSAVGEFLAEYLEEHPAEAKAILQKSLLAAEAREAARKSKQLIRERKGAMAGGGLPGKLRDCTSKEVERCELYLVEGDSAGGSAEGARLREFQAILPLRGKIINAYKSREDKVLSNDSVRNMISAIGVGFGQQTDLAKRRYNKIVIMTDADSDGSHIRTLLLTFFYRQMTPLVEHGHVYVAQPPLFRVRTKKQTYYVQTEEEMKAQLLELGLADVVFEAEDGRTLAGEELARLCRTLAALEEPIYALERRGISLRDHAQRVDAQGRLPMYHVFLGPNEYWFHERSQVDAFVAEQEQAVGEELDVSDQPTAETNGRDQAVPRPRLHIVELHEVRSINTGLNELRAQGFDIQALLPQERTGLEEPRYRLRRGESSRSLDDLRGLLQAVREAGEKGLQVTRFKGLGEMDPEELRETTLDPTRRVLRQVRMEDAAAADDIFRILMGKKVEPRREFIEKHALEVRNLDV